MPAMYTYMSPILCSLFKRIVYAVFFAGQQRGFIQLSSMNKVYFKTATN